MKQYNLTIILVVVVVLLGPARQSLAQVVAVTARLDTNIIAVGQSTTLRVYAQVLPAYRAGADRIFSWYVDVLNTNGTAASANYSAMLKTASDKDPLTSSNGFTSGANRLGVYDTFLNRPGAGVSNLVELMSIPVSGLAVGQTRFGVLRGTGVANLSEDFLVAPTGGGEFMTGGDYSAAFANLTVFAGLASFQVDIAPVNATQRRLTYPTVAGFNYTIELRTNLVAGSWQALAGGPHNSGNVIVTNSNPQLFLRVSAAP